jgi:hypothetical protein
MHAEAKRDVRELIREAFEQARNRGKHDWSQMTLGVLKNRILAITNGEFRESDYGAATFSNLLSTLSDVVTVDATRRPAIVSLVGVGSDDSLVPVKSNAVTSGDDDRASEPPSTDDRVRPDLWRAVMDFKSGDLYVWKDGEARVTSESDPGDRVLPTLTPTEMELWRLEFVSSVRGTQSEHDAARLDEWVNSSGRTSLLPTRLRPVWNGTLKLKVWERLNEWFSTHPNPPDVLLHGATERRHTYVETDLRGFLLRAISHMNSDELAQVQLPASAARRLFGS